MAVIITINLKVGERLICEKCGKEVTENGVAFLDLDLMREAPKKVYCSVCRKEIYPLWQ